MIFFVPVIPLTYHGLQNGAKEKIKIIKELKNLFTEISTLI
jgi:hypothetical protein